MLVKKVPVSFIAFFLWHRLRSRGLPEHCVLILDLVCLKYKHIWEGRVSHPLSNSHKKSDTLISMLLYTYTFPVCPAWTGAIESHQFPRLTGRFDLLLFLFAFFGAVILVGVSRLCVVDCGSHIYSSSWPVVLRTLPVLSFHPPWS